MPLLAESLRVALASRVLSGLVLALAAAIPIIVLGATGLNVAARSAILARVDDVGTRTMAVVSVGDPSIPTSAVGRIASLSGVDWVLGLGPAVDVRIRQGGGSPTPLRSFRTIRAPILLGTTSDGAYVSVKSAQRLGVGGAFGTLDPGGIKVAGWFDVGHPIEELGTFALLPTRGDDDRLERVIVSVSDVGWIEPTASSILPLLGRDAATSVSIERSRALLEAREVVGDEVSRQDRILVIALLAVEVAIVGVVVFAGTLSGRRDFGRRRALGATQGQLTMLVILTALWPALVGAALGTVVGWMQLGTRLDRIPDWRFPLAVGILAVLSVMAAAAIPAAIAATRDPVRVLRTP